MCVVMMLGAIAYVANQVGDDTVATLALMGAGAVLGFFFWNFPGGLIFLGDGGAYFLGFYVAELGILLLARNPGGLAALPAADLHLPGVRDAVHRCTGARSCAAGRWAAPTAFTCTA